jgi:hypothetical protein
MTSIDRNGISFHEVVMPYGSSLLQEAVEPSVASRIVVGKSASVGTHEA